MKYTNSVDVKELTIFSQSGTPDDIRGGIGEVNYYESILQTSISASVVFTDTGWRNYANSVSTVEEKGSDIQFAEKVHLKLQDEEENKITLNTDDTCLRIIRKPYDIGTTQRMTIPLYLSTTEMIKNELVPYYVNKRYNGKISDTIQSILTDVLKTKKPLDIEPTLNLLNIIGDQQGEGEYGKVFSTMVNLASKSIPDILNAKSNIAGYFFFETSEGYKFKSIDNLLAQEPKRKLIYTGTTSLPAQILTDPKFNADIDVIRNLRLGTYNTQRYTLDVFESKVRKNDVKSQDQLKAAVLAGKYLPKIQEEFNHPSKITNNLRDTGNMPPGDDILTQLQKSKELNFEIEDILNPAIMRYNQLFAIKTSFTIFSDLTLHAGDMIECHFPEVSSKKSQQVSDKRSGRYLIVNLRHYISPSGPGFTRLDVVRDSFGRK
jgi:hypothetical protein